MGRAIGAAIAGYVAMFVVVFIGNAVSWLILGTRDVFLPAPSWTTSAAFNLANIVVATIAALAGGFTCALVSRRGRALGILVGIIAVMSIVYVVGKLMTEAPTEPRPEVVAMSEAIKNAREPLWALLVTPVIGIVGAAVGFRLRGGSISLDRRDPIPDALREHLPDRHDKAQD